jgi:hypothetical protein
VWVNELVADPPLVSTAAIVARFMSVAFRWRRRRSPEARPMIH